MVDPEFTRRERKLAETRLGLLDALLARLDTRELDDISVKELCEAQDISEPTFFNHFATKHELLVYFVGLWSLEMAWHARRARGVKAAVKAIFAATAAQVTPHPRVMAEIIAYQARLTAEPRLRDITRAERKLRFPTLEGIETVEAKGFDGLVEPLLEAAVASGELSAQVVPRTALLALASIFFGVPLVLGPVAPQLIGPAYEEQLDITWRGLVAHARSKGARHGKG